MLSRFRGLVSGFGAWVIVGLFILAFAFVGVAGPNNFGIGEAVQVGNKGFSIRDVERELNRQTSAIREETGRVLSAEEAVEEGILAQALTVLERRALVEAEADTLGLTTTDEIVQNHLNNQEVFQNPATGRFDQTVLIRVIRNLNMSVDDFEVAVQNDIIQSQMREGLALNLPAPAIFGELVALRQTEERIVKIARLPISVASEPDDAALLSYYEENSDRYQSPELRQYSLVTLSEESLSDRINVPESDVRQMYEAQQASLGTPETRSFVQAQFLDMDTANDVASAVAGGQSLEEAAAAAGIAVTQLNDQPRSSLVDPKVADAVFALAEPGLTPPVDGEFAVVLADVRTITEGTEISFEDMEDALREQRRAELLSREVDILREEIQQGGDRGQDLATIADELGLDMRVVGPVDRTFLTLDGAFEDAPVVAHEKAFTLQANTYFEEVDLDDGSIAFVEVQAITPAAARPFTDVSDNVLSDYLADQRETAASDAVAAFSAAIAGGQPFDVAAVTLGGSVSTETIGLRDTAVLPQAITGRLFNATMGTLVDGRLPGMLDEVVVAQAESVRFGPNGQLDSLSALISRQVGSEMSQELFAAYLDAASATYKVTRNDKEIARRFGVN